MSFMSLLEPRNRAAHTYVTKIIADLRRELEKEIADQRRQLVVLEATRARLLMPDEYDGDDIAAKNKVGMIEATPEVPGTRFGSGDHHPIELPNRRQVEIYAPIQSPNQLLNVGSATESPPHSDTQDQRSADQTVPPEATATNDQNASISTPTGSQRQPNGHNHHCCLRRCSCSYFNSPAPNSGIDASTADAVSAAARLTPSPGSIAGQRRKHSQISLSPESGATEEGTTNAVDQEISSDREKSLSGPRYKLRSVQYGRFG